MDSIELTDAKPRPMLSAGPSAEPSLENQDLEDELSEEVSELVDRLDVLRSHVDGLRLNVKDPILAWRELRNILDEVDQVKAAMSAAHGDADLPPHLA